MIMSLITFLCCMSAVCFIFAFFNRRPYRRYKKYDYEKLSGKKFHQAISNRINRGEFDVYCTLRDRYPDSFFLSNLYVINPENKDITEIDLVMIHHTGIYVFESKAYHGCIWGDEKDHYWFQKVGRKRTYQFYNTYVTSPSIFNIFQSTTVTKNNI